MNRLVFVFFLTAACIAVAAQQHDIKRSTYIYSVKGSDTLLLDVYIDEAAAVSGRRPVMLHVHGGGFSAGSRKNVAQEMFNRHFAEMGFVSVSIDYRLALAPDNKYNVKGIDEAVRIATEDLVDATAFILAKSDVLMADTFNIMISGGSAGAITCLALEYDLCNRADYTKKLPHNFNFSGIISHAGAIPSKPDALVWAEKPCPMLLFFGDKDMLVPFDKGEVGGLNWMGSKYLHRQFEEMQVPHWVFEAKGADHVMAMKPLTDNNEETDKFYRSFIVGKCNSTVYTEWSDAVPPDMTSVEQMLKYVPLYILGFGKYLEEMENMPVEQPKNIVF
jgi:poly(3-hydroxybutyrate) depolymerase